MTPLHPPLDPRAPLVIDTRDLGRRPGASSRVRTVVPAPTDLGNPMAGVPVDSEIELDLLLESVVDGVLVSGTARVHVHGECGRCLDPLPATDTLDVDLQELFLHPATDARGRVIPDAPADDEAEELPRLVDDLLDLEPVLRDAVVLALPLTPLCRPDCPGLCSQCGARLADDPAHTHSTTDARWSGLAALRDER